MGHNFVELNVCKGKDLSEKQIFAKDSIARVFPALSSLRMTYIELKNREQILIETPYEEVKKDIFSS